MRRLFLCSVLSLLPMPALAQTAPADLITQDAVKAHVQFLADDLLEGRDTGARGHEIAARYVASRFTAIGLTPVVKDSWYQRVPFVEVRPNEDAKLIINGASFTHKKDAVIGGNCHVDAEVVFGGFCLERPDFGLRDLSRVKVKGKIVACLSGYPKGLPSDIGAHLSAEKTRRLSEQGAIGTLTIRTLEREKQMPWARVISSGDERSVRWANADGTPFDAAPNVRASATLDRAAANALFAGTGRTLDDILAEANRKGGKPRGFTLKIRATLSRTATLSPFTSPNVIGMLPGSDPALANEYVLVMGHLDHIGMRKGEDGDLINNGAMDNAGGIASMLEAARAMAAARDQVGLSPDPLPEEGLFTRSDHYRFVQRGIPSVFLMTGFAGEGGKSFRDFLATHYHRVSDDLNQPFNWQAAVKFARINMLIATEIANMPLAPIWYSDSFFGKTFAPDAPKAKRP